MKWLSISIVSILTIQPLAAQEFKSFHAKQLCAPWQYVANKLKEYDEDVLFTADGQQIDLQNKSFKSGMIFQVNQETSTWSLVSIYGEGTACIVATGNAFRPYSN
tara:strand:- start:199 stop:513 length:315 start_codon:yes stop_codon:yes gene_type:complete